MSTEIIKHHKQQILETVGSLLQGFESVSLVAFPDHWNVGDSAIWLASVKVLESLGIRVNYVCDYRTYHKDELKKYCGNNPILICGGGNFGDIYPNEQGLREAILTDFPDQKIIQLPQSIRFKSEEAIKRVQDLVNSHPSFTLIVRETPSLEIAQRLFTCEVILCPDMALALQQELTSSKKTVRKYTVLKRNDGESNDSSNISALIGSDDHLYDWMEETEDYARKHWGVKGRLAQRLVNSWINSYRNNTAKYIPMKLIIKATAELARTRTLGGLDVIDDSEFVITDRLHAGIMASLSPRKTILVDNDYHKNRSVYEAWFKDYPYLKISTDFNEALAQSKAWVD